MADPEIALPPRPSDQVPRKSISGNSSRPLGNKRTIPHSPRSTQSDPSVRAWSKGKFEEVEDDVEDERWPITYHYLTFETELPHSASITPIRTEFPDPPAPPDLIEYISPFLWSDSRKRLIIWLSCVATTFTAFTAGAYSPGAEQMKAEWTVSTVAILCGITTFTTGFAIAPMVLAPFSEINGRRPVFIASGLLFVLCQLCCALTRSYGGMLAARFFVGVGGSTFSTMVGGVVSDIYDTADRNTPMALFSAGALVGTGLGPFVTGFIAEHISWRWMFYLQTIMDGVLMIFIVAFFKETRGSVLLSRKAKALNRWYEQREQAGYY